MPIARNDRCVIVGADWGGLAVAEDLRSVGVKTLVVATRPQEFAHLSRYADRGLRLPMESPDSPRLLQCLQGETAWHGGSLVATTDGAVEYLCKHRDELAETYHLCIEDWETTRDLLDKQRLYRRATDCGLPIPRTTETAAIDSYTSLPNDLVFPVIVKPTRGHEFFARFKTKMFVAANADQLRLALDQADAAGLGVMVSEIVPGGDDELFQCRLYVDREGDPLATVCTRKVRQHPPGFGCGRVSRTVPPIEALRDASLRLLDDCGYRGFAHVEFKRDRRDGEYKLIEVNVRPPAMQRLPTAAGVNFSQIAHLDRVHGVSKAVPDYEPGVYWIDLFMDPLGWVRWRGAEQRRGSYFKPYFGRRVFNVRPLADPIPFLAKAWKLARQAPGYYRSRRAAGSGAILSSRGDMSLLEVPSDPSGA